MWWNTETQHNLTHEQSIHCCTVCVILNAIYWINPVIWLNFKHALHIWTYRHSDQYVGVYATGESSPPISMDGRGILLMVSFPEIHLACKKCFNLIGRSRYWAWKRPCTANVDSMNLSEQITFHYILNTPHIQKEDIFLFDQSTPINKFIAFPVSNTTLCYLPLV